jgi:NAD(P)H-dependent nitrite reductase large subunit/NAD(P)H-dependent nitrite reductase small subunit
MPGTLVVVGNGMVGHRFCEKLVEYGNGYSVTVFGEEPRPAYDRVHLTDYFKDRSADKLAIGTQAWYAERGIQLLTGAPVVSIDKNGQRVATAGGGTFAYDSLVLATGSAPFVPPVPGGDKKGVFVYRTIEDLEGILAYAGNARRAAVIGGGLLGLEAARAVKELGLETHVIEVATRLMPRQLDGAGSALLEQSIRNLGVTVHIDRRITCFTGDAAVTGIELSDGETVEVDLIIISAGIRPRDELARKAGIEVGPRGGVVVDDQLRTSDQHVFAIGEVALHQGMIYGLVAPGYEMADVLAKTLTGQAATFTGGDLSAKLKLMGTDVASFGDPFVSNGNVRNLAFEDQIRGVYKKLLVDVSTRRLLGGILVGDTKDFTRFQYLARSASTLSETMDELAMSPGSSAGKDFALPDEAQVCSCNSVTAGRLRGCIREGSCSTTDELKKATRAGTGCGGCMPVVTDILGVELKALGKAVRPRLCEHFAHTRQDLFQIIASKRIRTFADLIREHGQGSGCEICKPTVASILASLWNEPVLKDEHRTLQDTNDRFLANIQRNGTYSVIPRIPGGEITPEKLVVLGKVARKFDLHSKITGGQRVDLLGAQLEDLPTIWQELVSAGFESGHAYGKALRTVKSCVGSTWCRFGVQDSTAMAIRLEERYKGIRAPHKIKSAVSGCIRECAEAQGKDFGLIATEKGWNIYVCGNGGSHPRHADILAKDVDEETAIRYIDRFIMFYIRTADRLTRTSVWLDKMEGGIERLREIIVDDALGIAADLERDLQYLVDTFECEWTGVLRSPERRAQFTRYAKTALPAPAADERSWVALAKVSEVPRDGGIAARYGKTEIAIFNFATRGEWFASQNLCPHKRQMVLARGILGDMASKPKVACPLHKNTFDLRSGACLNGDLPALTTFPVKVEGDDVLVYLPPADSLASGICPSESAGKPALSSVA